MAMGSVLVTGGAGFLGSHLVERLSREGHFVVAVDNFSSGYAQNRAFLGTLKNVKFIEGDAVTDWQKLLAGVTWPQPLTHVFHFASPASPPHFDRLSLEIMWVNSIGVKNALEYADSHKARVVFASTSEVYGDPAISPQPETYFGNVNSFGARACYDESKRFGEALIYNHNRRHKTRHGLVRIFNTYGPRMNPADGRVLVNFLLQAERGEALTVFGDGKQTRSFCYVDDLVEGILRYAQSDLAEPMNIGNDGEFTMLELAEKVRALYSAKNLKITYHPMPPDDPKQRRPDLSKAKKLLQWSPKIPLEEGIKRFAAWMSEQS